MSAKADAAPHQYPNREGQEVTPSAENPKLCDDCHKQAKHQHQYVNMCKDCMKNTLLDFEHICRECADKVGTCVCKGHFKRA